MIPGTESLRISQTVGFRNSLLIKAEGRKFILNSFINSFLIIFADLILTVCQIIFLFSIFIFSFYWFYDNNLRYSVLTFCFWKQWMVNRKLLSLWKKQETRRWQSKTNVLFTISRIVMTFMFTSMFCIYLNNQPYRVRSKQFVSDIKAVILL